MTYYIIINTIIFKLPKFIVYLNDLVLVISVIFDLIRILLSEKTVKPTLKFYKRCCVVDHTIILGHMHMHLALKRDDVIGRIFSVERELQTTP